MPFGLSTTELLIVLVIGLLVFGAKRLPEIGNSIGRGIREFRRGFRDVEHTIQSGDDVTPPPPPPPRPLDASRGADRPQKLSE